MIMTQAELTEFNLGKTLDNLVNIDPRGYGVCNILYEQAYHLAGEPLTMHASRVLRACLHEGDTVFIITGFVLRPYNKQETDGPVGAAALARTLIKVFGVKPVFVVPCDAVPAMEKLSAIMGFHLYKKLEDVAAMPLSAGIIEFTKDASFAEANAQSVIKAAREAGCFPAYCISTETAGANKLGVYHNAIGLDVSPLEAKSDVLFARLQKEGVPTLAIGDLGNECGMGTLKAHLEQYIPYAAPGRCTCGCGGGIAAATAADTVFTTTVSNWGAYAICAALAYLARKPDALYTPELEERALTAASECGLIDMYGWQIPQVDGMNLKKNNAIITLMNECVLSAIELEQTCKTWFQKTIELGFFDKARTY
jgi:hypothetical protein